VVDEWETQSQADPTGFHVNVLEVGGTAQTANDNGADINAILVDTGNLVSRITAALFSGITSMAQWLGALAGKQASNATAQTEMRATGAGSGSYLSTTDSNEAARDALTALQADLPSAPTKNVALAGFPFFMVLTSDHVTGGTGLSVTAERSIDGGAFGATTNSVVEIASGVYTLDMSAADLNGDTICFKFTAATADARIITIVTQPT
jgi:hypothetical protein